MERCFGGRGHRAKQIGGGEIICIKKNIVDKTYVCGVQERSSSLKATSVYLHNQYLVVSSKDRCSLKRSQAPVRLSVCDWVYHKPQQQKKDDMSYNRNGLTLIMKMERADQATKARLVIAISDRKALRVSPSGTATPEGVRR